MFSYHLPAKLLYTSISFIHNGKNNTKKCTMKRKIFHGGVNMTIDQLKSGSWRIRQQYNGKRYTIVVDHKPTKKEALMLMSAKMDEKRDNSAKSGTFKEYLDKYIDEAEKAGKSPATISGYRSISRNMPEWFSQKNAFDISQDDVQTLVDEYAETHAPKSTLNYFGLVRPVLAQIRPNLDLSIKLPQAEKKAEYEPTTKDIQSILEYATGSKYECALKLCALGLRRGEVCAITADDLNDDNVLTINKDIVRADDGTLVTKNMPKTEESNRRILLPADVAELIRKQGYAYNGYPNSILRYLNRVQDELNIPRFRLHLLRHFCAAYLHKAGFTDQQILSYGGWSNASAHSVMTRVYRYNLDPEESQKQIAETFGNIF